ncbi:MAG TPA: extracellular solute-binding protein [Chloroflexota bacterium]|jgi:ABC-type glycerol-3-phosphate transport system substrate-binding protein
MRFVHRRVNRRSFLAGLGAGAASLLAACAAPPAPTSEPKVVERVVEKPVEVTRVVEKSVEKIVEKPVQVVITTTPAPAAAAPKSSGPIEVTKMAWWWTELGRRDAWRQQVSLFHNTQDKWRIKEKQVNFGDYGAVTLRQLASGGIDADMLPTFPELTSRLTKGGAFVPLDDISNDLRIHDRIRPGVKNWTSYQGKLYGLDTVTAALGLYYYEPHYKEKGLKLATTPEEFVDVATKLTDRSKNQFGFWNPVKLSEVGDSWLRLKEFALAYDGVWAQGKKPVVTSEPVRKGLQFAKDLYDKAMPQGMANGDQWTLFISGKATQTIVQSPILNGTKNAAPTMHADMRSAAVPWASKKSIARVHPMHISKTSKYQDAGRDFFKQLFTPANYVQFTIDCFDFIPQYPIDKETPGVTDDTIKLWNDYLKNTPQAAGYQTMLGTYLPDGDLLGDFVNNNDEFGQIVVRHFEGVLMRQVPLDKAVGDMQKELEDLATRITV